MDSDIEDRFYLCPCPSCHHATLTSDGVRQPKTRPVIIVECDTCHGVFEFKLDALDIKVRT